MPTRPTLEVLLVAALVATLAFGVGQCAGERREAQDAATRIALENGQRLAVAFHAAYDRTDSLRRVSVALEKREAAERHRAELAETALTATLDSTDVLLADSAATREALRAHLARLSSESRAHLAIAASYRETAATMAAAFATERAGYRQSLALADSTIRAKDAALRQLQQANRCRIVGLIPCPSRTATGLGAVVLTLAAVVALR